MTAVSLGSLASGRGNRESTTRPNSLRSLFTDDVVILGNIQRAFFFRCGSRPSNAGNRSSSSPFPQAIMYMSLTFFAAGFGLVIKLSDWPISIHSAAGWPPRSTTRIRSQRRSRICASIRRGYGRSPGCPVEILQIVDHLVVPYPEFL